MCLLYVPSPQTPCVQPQCWMVAPAPESACWGIFPHVSDWKFWSSHDFPSTQQGNCYVWNLTGGIGDEVTQLIPKTKIPAHTRYALQCRFSPDSTLLATCSADQTCKIWRTSNFSLMTELSIKSSNPGESSRGWMWGCAFSGDSQYIVTASSDNLARLWCVETGEIKREYGGHQKAVVCLAFNDSVLG
ncbi:MTOR associated protein, LST8-like protein [Phyllostomus discolor]|uniref:Target of rapamycin complex subunit LST8 n=1 Tax=Phyllostomus discolor TaxID=89673 RepID=A0A834BB12_9CHIR|nr:MTOR associated protein, LST8-like protein [Phyllostomus discolor]